jgi:hypothetical protein
VLRRVTLPSIPQFGSGNGLEEQAAISAHDLYLRGCFECVGTDVSHLADRLLRSLAPTHEPASENGSGATDTRVAMHQDFLPGREAALDNRAALGDLIELRCGEVFHWKVMHFEAGLSILCEIHRGLEQGDDDLDPLLAEKEQVLFERCVPPRSAAASDRTGNQPTEAGRSFGHLRLIEERSISRR